MQNIKYVCQEKWFTKNVSLYIFLKAINYWKFRNGNIILYFNFFGYPLEIIPGPKLGWDTSDETVSYDKEEEEEERNIVLRPKRRKELVPSRIVTCHAQNVAVVFTRKTALVRAWHFVKGRRSSLPSVFESIYVHTHAHALQRGGSSSRPKRVPRRVSFYFFYFQLFFFSLRSPCVYKRRFSTVIVPFTVTRFFCFSTLRRRRRRPRPVPSRRASTALPGGLTMTVMMVEGSRFKGGGPRIKRVWTVWH